MDSLRVVGRGTCLWSPPWTSARVPGGDPGVCRAPWGKGRGIDVEARVCSPSKSKGVNAVSGEGASDLSVADFTGIAKELDFIPGAVESHYRLLAGGDHNPNICLKKGASGCCVQGGEKKVAWKGGTCYRSTASVLRVFGSGLGMRCEREVGYVGVTWACAMRGKWGRVEKFQPWESCDLLLEWTWR